MTFETEVSTAETRVVELADIKNPTGKSWSKIAEKDGAVVVRLIIITFWIHHLNNIGIC